MPRRSQEERSRTTRSTLVVTGRRLFTERGYSGVSAEEIVADAGVTRGALYHHFGDKRGLFVAVLEEMETEITAELSASLDTAPDLMSAMVVGIGSFLDICQRPEVLRLGLTDAPAVLGWQGWRELEARHGLGLVTEMLERAVEGEIVTAAPVPVLAQLIFSAVIESGLIVAHAEQPEVARAEAEQSLMMLVSGILATPTA